MIIGSIFSGIGGLELGLERAGLGPVSWQIEIDPYCRSVLARHWPNAVRFEDVKTATALPHVELICGGFPCQDVSSAGKGAGLAGERSGLWFEFARIVGELRPRWVVVENVASGATRWVDQVMAGLAELDYQALPIPLSARDVGAPHRRARIFVVGYTHRCWESVEPLDGEVAKLQSDPGYVADAQRIKLREQSGRSGRENGAGSRELGDDGAQRESADAASARYERTTREGVPGERRPPIQPSVGTWSIDTMPKPALCRMDDGLSAFVDRNSRLKALGNAVVPQCAEVIGWVVRELESSK